MFKAVTYAAFCLVLVDRAACDQAPVTQLLAQASAAEARSDFENAAALYGEILKAQPDNEQAAIGNKRARFQAAQTHVTHGLELRRNGDRAGALKDFEIAAALDPSSFTAREEAARTEREMRPERVGPELADVPKLAPSAAPIAEITIHNQPASVIFDTLAKQSGIDAIFDPGLQPSTKTFNLHLVNKTVEEALDEAAAVTRYFWKPLSPNSIFVAQDNQQNRHEFEDQVLSAFYLHNMTSAQDLGEIMNVLRTMLDLRRVLAYSPQNAIFVRGSADQVLAARQLLEDMDKPKSEVVIDVVVMETSRTRSRQISAALSGSAALGIPITFTPRGATGTSTATPVSALQHLSSADFSVGLPGLNLTLDASDNQTKVLQSPQVRASDGQKASLKIGTRVPYASGSFSSAAAPTLGNPLVNTQFAYADIGVNVELTPRVHGRDELTLHIDIDISTVADHADIGGISEPVIGQRKVGHEVRLKDGQPTVLAGLAESTDSKQTNGIPGLFNIPILRRLFGSDKVDRTHTDLLIVLIPHIVKSPDYTPSNLRPMYIGSDTVVRVKPAGVSK